MARPSIAAPTGGNPVTMQGNAIVFVPNRPSTQTTLRRPKFVSPSTMSVAISVNGGAVAYSDVSTNSTLCTTGTGGRTCTVPVTAPVGTDSVIIKLYDAAAGAGTLLGTGTATTTVAAGTPFSVSIPVSPVVAYLANASVTYANGSSLTVGTPNSFTISFSFLDPDGNTIQILHWTDDPEKPTG